MVYDPQSSLFRSFWNVFGARLPELTSDLDVTLITPADHHRRI